MRRDLHRAVLLVCALAACAKGDIVPGVSDSTFVATMADLRRVDVAQVDSSARAATRQRILQRRGLTVEQLDHAATALAADPARATALFQAIERRAVNAADSATGR